MSLNGVSARPRQRLQEELVPRQKSAKTSEREVERKDSEGERRGRSERGKRRRRGEQTQPSPTTPTPPPVSTTPNTGGSSPVTTQPVGGATPVQSPEARTLAERYVSQYEQQSGNTLSSEARTAKIQEVASFYDDPDRLGRLSKIVFA